MEVIRVLHIVGYMNRGGQETVLMNIFREIDRTKIQFDFVVQTEEKCAYDDEIISLGGCIYHLPAIYQNPVLRFHRLKKIIRDNNYQIVHRHSDKAIEWVDVAAAKLGGAKVRIYHGRNSSSKFKAVHYICRPINNSLSTHKYACSEQAGRWVYGKRLYDSGKVLLIPNCIDVEKFRFNPDVRSQMRNMLGIQDKCVIGHVGRFEPQKNHTFLIDIFVQIKKQKANAILVLIGDGILKTNIEQKVNALGLNDSVLFLGSRDDVHELYQAMDVFVLPSLFEGFCNVITEAITSGLPCVFTKGLEHIDCGNIGQLRLTDSVFKWADSIISIAVTDRHTNTHNIVRLTGYDLGDCVQNISELYYDLTFS